MCLFVREWGCGEGKRGRENSSMGVHLSCLRKIGMGLSIQAEGTACSKAGQSQRLVKP